MSGAVFSYGYRLNSKLELSEKLVHVYASMVEIGLDQKTVYRIFPSKLNDPAKKGY
jgi:hypothetical protein